MAIVYRTLGYGVTAGAFAGCPVKGTGECFAGYQTAGAGLRSRQVGQRRIGSAFGFAFGVGGDGNRTTADVQRAVGIGDGVVAGSQSAGGDGVCSRVGCALAGAGVGQRAVQNGAVFAVEQTGVGDAVAAAVGLAVLGFTGIGCGDGERRGGYRQGAVGIGYGVVAGREGAAGCCTCGDRIR